MIPQISRKIYYYTNLTFLLVYHWFQIKENNKKVEVVHFNSMFTEGNIFYIVIKVELLEFHSSYIPHHHHSAFSPFLYLICEMLWSILNNVVHTHQLKTNYAQLSRAVFNSNDNFWPDSFTFWSNINWEVFFEFPSWWLR